MTLTVQRNVAYTGLWSENFNGAESYESWRRFEPLRSIRSVQAGMRCFSLWRHKYEDKSQYNSRLAAHSRGIKVICSNVVLVRWQKRDSGLCIVMECKTSHHPNVELVVGIERVKVAVPHQGFCRF